MKEDRVVFVWECGMWVDSDAYRESVFSSYGDDFKILAFPQGTSNKEVENAIRNLKKGV